MAQLSIAKHPQTIHYFAEPLHPSPKFLVKPINMVLILGGTFQMGSPETELEQLDRESPQHQVTVPSFFMNEFPIVKAHWWAVAETMQKIEIELNKSPAHFKGTDRENLNWSGAYGSGTKGIYRQETTPVDTFPPNAFGLYDLHGNVWEWCQDHWHKNYRGAPTDGSAWIDLEDKDFRVLRGGSWSDRPLTCRSATRISLHPDDRYDSIGFRVVCEIPRTETLDQRRKDL